MPLQRVRHSVLCICDMCLGTRRVWALDSYVLCRHCHGTGNVTKYIIETIHVPDLRQLANDDGAHDMSSAE